MKKRSTKDKIRHLFQTANGQPILGGGVGASQSPLLSRLFDPNTTDLAQFFNAFFKTAIIVGAMLAVLRLGYAGFMYMTTDSFGDKGKAKSIIQEAVIGLLLLLSIWLILNQINPNLLNLNILQRVSNTSSSIPNSNGQNSFTGGTAQSQRGQWCYTGAQGGIGCFSQQSSCVSRASADGGTCRFIAEGS